MIEDNELAGAAAPAPERVEQTPMRPSCRTLDAFADPTELPPYIEADGPVIVQRSDGSLWRGYVDGFSAEKDQTIHPSCGGMPVTTLGRVYICVRLTRPFK
jgi:hypothetical protein